MSQVILTPDRGEAYISTGRPDASDSGRDGIHANFTGMLGQFLGGGQIDGTHMSNQVAAVAHSVLGDLDDPLAGFLLQNRALTGAAGQIEAAEAFLQVPVHQTAHAVFLDVFVFIDAGNKRGHDAAEFHIAEFHCSFPFLGSKEFS